MVDYTFHWYTCSCTSRQEMPNYSVSYGQLLLNVRYLYTTAMCIVYVRCKALICTVLGFCRAKFGSELCAINPRVTCITACQTVIYTT